jgi:hypothetical protein
MQGSTPAGGLEAGQQVLPTTRRTCSAVQCSIVQYSAV